MPRVLGTVDEVAITWDLGERLLRVAHLERAYIECLKSSVEISHRSKVQAGAAYTRERRLVLNAALLLPGHEADRDATFLHECAHIVADLHHGRNCRHDWRWQRVMELLGEPPVVRHQIDYISPRAHAVVTWTCGNCGEEYHFVRPPRRRIQDCYCRPCGPELGCLRPARQRGPDQGEIRF